MDDYLELFSGELCAFFLSGFLYGVICDFSIYSFVGRYLLSSVFFIEDISAESLAYPATVKHLCFLLR